MDGKTVITDWYRPRSQLFILQVPQSLGIKPCVTSSYMYPPGLQSTADTKEVDRTKRRRPQSATLFPPMPSPPVLPFSSFKSFPSSSPTRQLHVFCPFLLHLHFSHHSATSTARYACTLTRYSTTIDHSLTPSDSGYIDDYNGMDCRKRF